MATPIYALLHRECDRLVPDEMLPTCSACHSVPPIIGAVVMVLQRIEGYSDREAIDRFTYGAR